MVRKFSQTYDTSLRFTLLKPLAATTAIPDATSHMAAGIGTGLDYFVRINEVPPVLSPKM